MARLKRNLLLCTLLFIGAQRACKSYADASAREKSFTADLDSLEATIAGTDIKDNNELQSQLSKLQAKAARLQERAKESKSLKSKLVNVEKELETTKETLSKTMGQLASKSSSVSESERKVTEATEKLQKENFLQKARAEREEAQKRLDELKATSQDATKLQKEIEVERSQRSDLQGEITKLKEKNSKLAAELSETQQAAEAARKDLVKWQSKAEKAEKDVEKAEKTLEKALQEHTATQSALIQAEAKAEEALKTVESLLTSWLPHWLQDRYQQLLVAAGPALKHIQPVATKIWLQGKTWAADGRVKALQAYAFSRSKSEAAWKDAKPRMEQIWRDTKKHTNAYTKHAGKTLAPQWTKLKAWLAKQYDSGYKSVAHFLDRNPSVIKLRRNAKQTMKELEGLAIRYLKQVPFLKDYAKRPAVTYIVYAVLAAPLITILVPLFALKGGKDKPRRKDGVPRASMPPESAAHGQNGRGGKSKKVRRISVGEEHVRVP